MVVLSRKRNPDHDPERLAAAYLNGDMRRARLGDFELHLRDCDDCWAEVMLARRGRILAESGRELAPPRLKDTIRARVDTLTSPRPIRLRWVPVVAALTVAVLLVVGQVSSDSSEHDLIMGAAVAEFQDRNVTAGVSARDVPHQAGQLRLVSSYETDLRGVVAKVHAYEDPSGQRARVYQGINMPMEDEHDDEESGWLMSQRTESGLLLCIAQPVASIIIGHDAKQLHLLASELKKG